MPSGALSRTSRRGLSLEPPVRGAAGRVNAFLSKYALLARHGPPAPAAVHVPAFSLQLPMHHALSLDKMKLRDG